MIMMSKNSNETTCEFARCDNLNTGKDKFDYYMHIQPQNDSLFCWNNFLISPHSLLLMLGQHNEFVFNNSKAVVFCLICFVFSCFSLVCCGIVVYIFSRNAV